MRSSLMCLMCLMFCKSHVVMRVWKVHSAYLYYSENHTSCLMTQRAMQCTKIGIGHILSQYIYMCV